MVDILTVVGSSQEPRYFSDERFNLEHTDISEKEYDKNYRRNWWLMSNEIIKLGIADKIVTNIEDLF